MIPVKNNVIGISNKMRKLVGLDFQCACCRELTKITIRKPGRLSPVTMRKQVCRVCESKSDLFIEKLKDGRICVKTTECFPTEEGMKHYYMYHPEKDPDYVQPDGRNDNQNPTKEIPNETDDSV